MTLEQVACLPPMTTTSTGFDGMEMGAIADQAIGVTPMEEER